MYYILFEKLNTCSSNVLKGNMNYYFTGQAKLEKCNIGSYQTTASKPENLYKSMSSIGVAQI